MNTPANNANTPTHMGDEAAPAVDPVTSVRQVLGLDSDRIPRCLPQVALQVLEKHLPAKYDVLRVVLEAWSAKVGDNDSVMKECFHPGAPFMALESLCADLTTLLVKFRKHRLHPFADQLEVYLELLPETTVVTIAEAHQLLALQSKVLASIGAVDADGEAAIPVKFVKTSKAEDAKPTRRARRSRTSTGSTDRKTCRAVLESTATGERCGLRVTDIRKALGLPGHAHALVGEFVAWVAKLCGRIHTWFPSWASAEALVVGKVGLVYKHLAEPGVLEDLAQLPHTLSFLTMAIAEFGARKAFTIESQRQGALNEYLRLLLGLVKLHEPEGFAHIAWILPVQEVFAELSPELCERIAVAHREWLPVLGQALNELWTAGVSRCFRRGAVVLPSGFNYKLNTTCWNHCADAWSNLLRFIRAAEQHAVEGTPVLKVLQLVAGDQARWAQDAGKGLHGDVATFRTLTCELGFLPWELAHTPEEWMVERALEFLRSTQRPNAWLGIPQLRDEQLRIHGDMVCGVAVPAELVEACILIGAFGANPWGGADAPDEDAVVDAADTVLDAVYTGDFGCPHVAALAGGAALSAGAGADIGDDDYICPNGIAHCPCCGCDCDGEVSDG
jgi:hypothetical protein